MNLLLSQSKLNAIKGNINKLLLFDNRLIAIDNLKTEIKTVKGFFGGEKKHEVITNIDILGYNFKGKFRGIYTDESEIEDILKSYDFYQLRNNWLVFNEQLKAFGFEVNKIVDVSGDD